MQPEIAIDGLVIVAKRDCPTCVLIEPVMRALAKGVEPCVVVSQDDPGFPAGVEVVEDGTLAYSYRLNIETVPTLLRLESGREVARAVGWHREEWRALTGQESLGDGLPDYRPGCGSLSVAPGVAEQLAVRFGDTELNARRIEVAPLEDDIEACFDRGWTDGLPVVPPTEARVYRMLQGTTRAPEQMIGLIPPSMGRCTVEKVAINAVMAGCKPEYLPVVLAAVEAALIDEFCMHGLLCTTWFAGPVVIVSGPITTRIGMNAGMNALGQGNRADASIGRALQLVIRNVGGGRPGEIDRSALSHPGKYTFCFAEDKDPRWEGLNVEHGFSANDSTVTLFAGDGVQGMMDQKSRTPESLANSFAACLRNVTHPKLVGASDALVVITPEHARVFHDGGWSKAEVKEAFHRQLQIPGHDLVTGAGGITEGLPPSERKKTLAKFRRGGINIVRAGGGAGMFSAIIGGWPASGETGSSPVTHRIED